MRRTYCAVFFVQSIFLSFCLCEITVEKKQFFLNGFIDYLKHLPNQPYTYEEGVLLDLQKTDLDNAYKITVRLKASDIHNLDDITFLNCTGGIVDGGESGITVRIGHQCVEDRDGANIQESDDSTTEEPDKTTGPVQLVNEVQSDTDVTSGEQFVAIPRTHINVPCIGCASQVDPSAAGVPEMAYLGIRHLDLHDPLSKHTLNTVVDVERQVQVVSGVRYVLTLLVDYNNCTASGAEPCPVTVPCKVSILEKPWKKLPDGSKYRAIVANNCTLEWQFGDEGEVLPIEENNENNEVFPDPSNNSDEDLKVIHNFDVQAQLNQGKPINDEMIKNIEAQIIPHSQFTTNEGHPIVDPVPISKHTDNINKDETIINYYENASPVKQSQTNEPNTLGVDKKEAIDGIMNFFDFAASHKADTVHEHHISALRKKRSLDFVGGEAEQDINNPKFKQFAEESLEKYLQTSGATLNEKVIKVTKVTTQVVSGSLTRIDFEVHPSNGDVFTCHSKVLEQPWLKKKEIDVNCDLNDKQSRTKRHTVGGETEQDSSDPKYKTLAHESLQKYLEASGATLTENIIKVTKVTTQVVSGTLTRIRFEVHPTNGDMFTCHSKIWEQPWLKKKEIDVNCDLNDKQIRNKRQTLVGGETEQDTSDPKYKTLAEESLEKYLQTSSATLAQKVVKVTKVTTQVVSGSLTRIDFEVHPSNGDVFTCHSKVWEQPWLKKKEIDVNCDLNDKQIRNKRQTLVGGETEQDTSDPKYKTLAEESLEKYLQTSSATLAQKVVKVTKVTNQVVSGSLTRIDFEVHPSNGDVFTCHSKIWEQPWLKKKEIDVNCDLNNKQTRAKRQIPGGAIEGNPSDAKYKTLAEESLEKYLQTSSATLAQKVVKVTKVTTQVVSGSLTRIDFEVVPSNGDVFKCHSEIWEQPWLNKKDIKVNCNMNNSKRHSRSIPGGARGHIKRGSAQIDDPNKPQYKTFAEKSLHKYMRSQDERVHHEVLEVKRVVAQVVSGKIYEIDFTAAPTTCSVDEMNTSECIVKNETILYCHTRVWSRAWLKSDKIDVVCNSDLNKGQTDNDNNEDFERERRNIISTQDNQVDNVFIEETDEKRNSTVRIKNNVTYLKPLDWDDEIPGAVDGELGSEKQHVQGDDDDFIDEDVKFYYADRMKRSVTMNPSKKRRDNIIIAKLAQESLLKLEESSLNRYKQRVMQINSYSTKIKRGRVTTIDFEVGYTSCLKYDHVSNISTCEFIDHLPKRHCVSHVFESLTVDSGKNIEVICEDDETLLESHTEYESAEKAMELANEALKHIEAKYPHPNKLKVTRILSLEKHALADIHYRMKIEVGFTDCLALSIKSDCKLNEDSELNRICRVNVWIKPWTDHAPNFRVSCDQQDGLTAELYHTVQAEQLFYDFIKTYRPDYMDDDEEMLKRFKIFSDNVKKVHELNVHERGTARYAMTRFSDLTYAEFWSKYLGLKPGLKNANDIPMVAATIPQLRLPEQFDWRERGAVTAVKDQGSCGSCWAFSVTGNIEGQWKLQTGKLVSLSEQELVDCDKLDQGCNGGLMDNAYRAVEELGGLETESDYPYEGEDDKCAFNKTMSKVQISGAVNISSNETDMAKWLVGNGPISIGINANAMQFYVGGVSHPWKYLCSPSNLDHGVLIVGFGVKDYPLFHKRLPYWIVKNSWGSWWGEQGYYRVYRGDGCCGVNQMASSAVV